MMSSRPNRVLKELITELLTGSQDEEMTHPARYPNHADAVEDWKRAMECGTMTGKPFSPITVDHYVYYVNEYLSRYPEVNGDHLRQAMEKMPVNQFARKNKYHRAIVSFAKFLIRENSLSESFLGKAKVLKPRRHLPPRQISVNEEQIKKLEGACKTDLDMFILTMLANTGLRAAEFCDLKVKDIYLDEGFLIVEKGKGNKRRKIGLNAEATKALKAHLRKHPTKKGDDPLTFDIIGQPITRCGVLTRMSKLGKRTGIEVSPHALRRAFVTINANKGRSLVMLQLACGHADITTTRSYCKTTEDEMIKAMKDW
ncbi:tyrosine-type recombinase/integrase [Vampirovibrio chlorellavorus]|uniref:tyrosine-type recombinase/integrase n=1 Tax=Vampirovibrio chlorellavorus TaxID=758823 RepID=UPI0026F2F3AC|nr:site-specific integrase [Vampirovibrio chlorellavorus]